MKIVITGGHHNCAIPVIQELRHRVPDLKIYWFGHRHTLKGNVNDSLEYIEITQLGIPFYNLKAGKFYKTFDIRRLVKIPFGFIQALYFLLKVKPDCILSFGGYLAVPTVFIGWLLGITSYTHEQTVTVGWGNKFVSKFAKKIFISWPSSIDHFNREKVIESGLPLRKELYEVQSSSFIVNAELPTIYLTAGKTGSHIINSIILKCLPELLSMCNLIHQTGDSSVYKDFDQLLDYYKSLKPSAKGTYYLRKYVLLDEIGEAFQKADLLIIRGGAHTTYESLSLNIPAIIIPIPWVSHNEQLKNAQVVVDSGLGYLLEEKNLTPTSLVNAVRTIIENKSSYKLNNEKLVKLLSKNSAKIIVDEIINS